DTSYLVTATTTSGKPLRVVVYNANDPSSIIDTTVFVADGPLSVIEIPGGTPGKVKIAVISETGAAGHPDTSAVPFKLNVYWSTTKQSPDSGQQTGQGPNGGAPSSGGDAPVTAPTTGGDGGDNGGGDVGQTPPGGSGGSGGDTGGQGGGNTGGQGGGDSGGDSGGDVGQGG
ncbi:MAG TPA: hypothetical protein VGU69_07865, partial [Rhizomicrobium sp.]|nr:hypothetical protein [Rhizomicrobium sp.]